ncbi:monovalent cation/H+ antiporter subunit D [Salinarchaeum sp. Harcht-Bsk1]|uniref:proton-conducting transporter transmembrane domain-containing protein n=1 Tax=Salinarchaeum sp. Harcht-Bsk1 TaxID=1333523 RepID=UPI00034235E5|nr:proton-conducting transporter membrane subunit [Salinarchaeum sp. Harcht-Bsk1]AGN00092.1 monovalent cation/H+ antiporter subunit D [Salinarchaeum sp. Harcht-Bsk1]
MSTTASLRPLLAVAIPTIAIVLIVATGSSRRNLRDAWSIAAAIGLFATVASMLPAALDGDSFRWSAGAYAPGIEFALQADPLGMLFATLSSLLWVFTAFYAIGYMRGLDESNQTRFFAAFAASLAAAVGIAFAANLLTIFVFYELLSVATYPLVAHDETDEARAAGRKYLLYTFFGGGVLVLGGAVLVYALAGTTTFGATAQGLATADPTLAKAAFAMLAAGFGVKAALMPLHSWLPDAMVAPTPVSGLLHAVAVVKAGAFGIARLVLDVFGPELVGDLGVGLPLAAVAAFTLLTASVIALRQDRLKRRLAYSTISQLSYIVLGLALLGPTAITGGLLHIPAHAFMKLTLFFCAGIIHVETHTDYISEMDGIGKRMPLTMTAFAVAAAGMAGIPLVAGFVSKWFILVGAVEVNEAVFAVALLVSGVLNIAYFWPIVYGAFFEDYDTADEKPLVSGSLGGHVGPRTIQFLKPAGAHHGEESGGALAGSSADDDRGEPAPLEDGEYAVDQNPSDHLPTSAEAAPDGESIDAPVASSAGESGNDSPDSDTVDQDADAADYESDHGHQDADHGHHDADHGHNEADHDHHGGPGPDGWECRDWTGAESTWLMLGPILAVAAGALVLGVVPYQAQFLELVDVIVAGVFA